MAKVVVKSRLGGEADDVAYWLTRPMSERVAAVEILRRRVFGGRDGNSSQIVEALEDFGLSMSESVRMTSTEQTR